MADAFGRQDQLLAGGLSSDSMFVSWPSLSTITNGGVGLLIQSVGIEYRQPLRRIFEIGPGVIPTGTPGVFLDASLLNCDTAPLSVCEFRTQPTYFIVGRPEGRLQMGRFVGPNVLTTCFYRKYGSPCGPNDMLLSGRAGCDATNAAGNPLMTWVTNGVVLDTLGMDITAQEMVIQERIGAMFTGLNILINGLDPDCTDAGVVTVIEQ